MANYDELVKSHTKAQRVKGYIVAGLVMFCFVAITWILPLALCGWLLKSTIGE